MKTTQKTIVAVSIQLLLAAVLIFRLGTKLGSTGYEFYYSYAGDFLLPEKGNADFVGQVLNADIHVLDSLAGNKE